jgi:hypothetical protein
LYLSRGGKWLDYRAIGDYQTAAELARAGVDVEVPEDPESETQALLPQGEGLQVGDLRVNRLKVQELVGGVDPPHPAEHRRQRLTGRCGQLDGPGAQPQPLGLVLWRRQRGHPGPDGVEFSG